MNIITDTDNRLVEVSKTKEQFVRVSSTLLTKIYNSFAKAENPQEMLARLDTGAAQLFGEFEAARAAINTLGGSVPSIVTEEYTVNEDGTVSYTPPAPVEEDPEEVKEV